MSDDKNSSVPTKSLEDYLYLRRANHQDDEYHVVYENVSLEVYTNKLSKARCWVQEKSLKEWIIVQFMDPFILKILKVDRRTHYGCM